MNQDRNRDRNRETSRLEVRSCHPAIRRTALSLAMLFMATAPMTLMAQKTHPAMAAASASLQSGAASQPQLEPRNPRYIIERQDAISLTFPLTPEFNQKVTVQPDGYIELEAVGSVHAQGLTVPQLKDAIRAAYAHTLHDPIVNVDLTNFQNAFFTISGQVGKPGKYNLRSDLTVAEAIAVAGGLAPTAKTQILLFHHTSPDSVEVKRVNLKKILNGKDLNEDAVLTPGDMIFVPEKFITQFKKYVPYSANGGIYAQPVLH